MLNKSVESSNQIIIPRSEQRRPVQKNVRLEKGLVENGEIHYTESIVVTLKRQDKQTGRINNLKRVAWLADVFEVISKISVISGQFFVYYY